MKSKLRTLRTAEQRQEFLSRLNPHEKENLSRTWWAWAHEPQIPPTGQWRKWLLMGGRGAGKTRSGAEWLKSIILKDHYALGDAAGRVALIGETYQDALAVMIEGESGLMAIHSKDKRPKWNASRRQLEWPNGTIGQVFSANDPESLRGSQFGAAWCDEVVKWRHLETTFDMLQFCMRLGSMPRQMITTTPKPLAFLKKMLKEKSTSVTRSSTFVNSGFLAPGFLAYVTDEYAGTRLGRQELNGEIIEDREGALWQRSQLDELRVKNHPPLKRIIIAVDPPASSNAKSDACGIVAAGKDGDGICYLLADVTIQGVVPEKWASVVTALYHRLEADCVIAEVNQGGDMVKSVLGMADPSLPIRAVRASRGKWLRAEPIAMLYAKGRVRHVGSFPELEDQLCDFGPDGLANGKSPDRLDAMVWALHELALSSRGNPRIRSA
ncbi:MAG: terminase family protein [Salaquimonas sp.]